MVQLLAQDEEKKAKNEMVYIGKQVSKDAQKRKEKKLIKPELTLSEDVSKLNG